VRPPFLDHRIIEFAATLPTSFKIRGARQKYLLKQLMGPKLPPMVVRHSKIGFDIPTHEWFRGPLRSMWLETLEGAEAEYAEIFFFDVIRKYTDRHMGRSVNIGPHLWGLMTLFLWMKRWKIQPTRSLSARSQLQSIEL
jgi:asparagine synthase (glutamine-hydrolysing)